MLMLNEMLRIDENADKSENNAIMPISNTHHNYLNMECLNATLKLIEVRIEFIQIGEVDTVICCQFLHEYMFYYSNSMLKPFKMNEKFQAIVKTRAKWYENSHISDYDPKEHWNPKLFIGNGTYTKKRELRYFQDNVFL